MNLKGTLTLLKNKLLFTLIVKPMLEQEFKQFTVDRNALTLICTLAIAEALLGVKEK